ncbi:MAG: hypothetical protein N3E51_02380 [Candidatus Micrarchaeota archaeon]|nr:hypothetical protein [Candidatus Micrarchaeota archaeon]
MGWKKGAAALLVIAVAFCSLLHAACPTASRQIYLAAVTGEESGGVFRLEVEIRPGSGTIYTAISPKTGFLTQESEQAAVEYAFKSTGAQLAECDVLFRLAGPFGENVVDGPSAGGAMAVALRAAILNRSIRQDVVITGTISPGGKIGPVGGIMEKALGAAEAGARYFLAPKLQLHEALLISSLAKTKEFYAIEVGDISEAEEVLFSDYSQNFSSRFVPQSSPLPKNLPPISQDAALARFGKISKKVVDELEAKKKALFPEGGQSPQLSQMRQYFDDEIAKYRKLLGLGYYFTAANSAFLLSIDAEYVKMGDAAGLDFAGSVEEVGRCIASLKPPKKTHENFHWAVGSDLRRIWAQKRMNESLERQDAQGHYTTIRDLLYSYSWCGISRELASEADSIGGRQADESVLVQLASKKISEAEERLAHAPKLDYDALWHLEAALAANQSGRYGAAIYDATYAKAMQEASSESNVSASAQRLVLADRKSLWGKIYQGQGVFLYYQAKESGFDLTDAYRVLKYASELDRSAQEMDRELAAQLVQKEAAAVAEAGGQSPAAKEYVPIEQDYPLLLFLTFSVVAFALGVGYRLALRMKKG